MSEPTRTGPAASAMETEAAAAPASPGKDPGESEGTRAAFAVHDLKNLLATVRGHAELQLERMPAGAPVDAALRQSLESIRLASDRAVRLCRGYLEAAGGRLRQQEAVAVGELVRGALRLFQGRVGDGLRSRASGPPEIVISGVRDDLERAVLNLLWNARDALFRAERTGQDGLVRVSWGEDATGAWIEVADNGPGLPEGRVPAAGTSASGSSPAHGLGLTEVARIARQHGGRLRGCNHPVTGGAILRLEFGIQRELEFDSAAVPDGPRRLRTRRAETPPLSRP
ncbi:MAG TPA: HAMP domain-containing sensor histidine kinase [Planctomycetota bacterium]